MAEPIDPNTRFIRKGAFGCVVEPALPNVNEIGHWNKFPGNVSKLFRKKANYNLALHRTRKAQNIMKNRGQRMNTYKHNYKPKNLLMREEIKKKEKIMFLVIVIALISSIYFLYKK